MSVEAAITAARILTRPIPRLEDEGMAWFYGVVSRRGYCFHIASKRMVHGSNANWPQMKYERGQEDNGAPEEIRTPDPQIRSLAPWPTP